MKDIAIFGAGGFGKEVACLIKRINDASDQPLWNIIGFFDDGKKKGDVVSRFGEVLGGMEELNNWATPVAIAIAIGNSGAVKTVVERIKNPNVCYPNLIDRSFYIVDPQTFKIGQGNIIQGQSSVSCDVEIGDFNILNGWVVIGHDVKIKNYNTFLPATRISGDVTIGSHNKFGAQSFVMQGLKIGDEVTLGPCSAMLSKPKDGRVYIGVPAKRFKF